MGAAVSDTVTMTHRLVLGMALDPLLSPNARAHWAKRHKHGASARREAGWLAKEQRPAHPLTGPLAVSVTICWAGKRGRLPDADNALAMCKPALDGLTDAGVWGDDRQIEQLTVRQERLDAVGRAQYPSGCLVIDVEAAPWPCPGVRGRDRADGAL